MRQLAQLQLMAFPDVTSGTANGAITFNQRENQSMLFNTNGTERMRLGSGGGLTFNGDTATTNALDDYEEGTWVTGIDGMTFSQSY